MVNLNSLKYIPWRYFDAVTICTRHIQHMAANELCIMCTVYRPVTLLIEGLCALPPRRWRPPSVKSKHKSRGCFSTIVICRMHIGCRVHRALR